MSFLGLSVVHCHHFIENSSALEESETPASTMEAEIYGMTESPGNYGEIDTPLLEPQIISLPRSEVTLVLVNIGCPETYQQDFQACLLTFPFFDLKKKRRLVSFAQVLIVYNIC